MIIIFRIISLFGVLPHFAFVGILTFAFAMAAAMNGNTEPVFALFFLGLLVLNSISYCLLLVCFFRLFNSSTKNIGNIVFGGSILNISFQILFCIAAIKMDLAKNPLVAIFIVVPVLSVIWVTNAYLLVKKKKGLFQ